VIVHFVGSTYELFRHLFGLRRFHKGEDIPFGALIGVVNTLLQMIEEGASHIGVATDHVIESLKLVATWRRLGSLRSSDAPRITTQEDRHGGTVTRRPIFQNAL
jgi:hypothetical protein